MPHCPRQRVFKIFALRDKHIRMCDRGEFENKTARAASAVLILEEKKKLLYIGVDVRERERV